MTEDKRDTRPSISEGIRQGLGVLAAVKDAIEETINEARERGDLSQERVKEKLREGLHKAQERASEARERFDFVGQRELDELREALDALTTRVAGLERAVHGAEEPAGHPAEPSQAEVETEPPPA